MPESTRRPFATGSKPGPDAVDHYLETQGYYRKHVARDASSLFRVVSEQIFDVQNYHEKVRQDCADFMESNSKDYSNEVDKNLYNYISNLRKARTHGTLLELRVLARKYRKNVVLFEPTQNLQTTNMVYVQNDEYDDKNPMRVFYSHKDKHFDVIFTMDYVERLAECQACVYMLLYKDVYRLPDVPYAVERMLHDQEEITTLPLPDDPSKYSTQSGEIFAFDLPEETNCVLKDPKTCHFHNQTNFEEVVDENKDAITVINRTDEPGRLKIFKPIDGFLHDKEKSCVRQLLDEHITPFPYKVAKALDPSIYRNTEFELWSENRKEQRMKWLDSAEFPMKPHFEDKWILYDRRGMRKSFDAVVDENAYMAMDEDMKKKYVVLNPSAEPFKLHHLTSLNHFVPAKDSVELTVMPVNPNFNRGNFKGNKRGGRSFYRDGYGNSHFQNRGHYNQQQQPPMPHVSEIEGREGYPPVEQQEMQPGYYQQTTQTDPENYDQQQPPMQAYQAYPPHQQWQKPMQVPMSPYHGQAVMIQQPMGYQNVMPYGNFSIPPPQQQEIQFQQEVPGAEQPAPENDWLNLLRDTELSSTLINYKSKESTDVTGADLPMSDLPTLQFFYNLGIRYFMAAGIQRKLENITTQVENLEIGEGGEKVDPPPVPTNTPVTTKMNYPQGGNRNPNQGNNNFRRQGSNNGNNGNYRNNWNNNGNNSGPRKEIRFNSNVKNVHKNDPKTANAGTSMSNNGKSKEAPITPKAHDKSPPNLQFSPLSPIPNENNAFQSQPVEYQQMQPQQQQFYQYPPTFMPQQVQAGVSVVYQVGEDGTYTMMHQLPQPTYQYTTQYQNQPPTPHFQPVFQPAPFAPPTPVYFQPVPNYQQPQQQQQQLMDASALSNDSGMVEASSYQTQQPVPYYPPYPAQVFYAQPPQTPQIAPAFATVVPAVIPQISQETAVVAQPPVEEQTAKNG